MPAERITLHRTNVDKTEVIEQYPKTITSQVYDFDNGEFLNDTLSGVTQQLAQTGEDLDNRGINVKNYGAKGDLVSDDSPFIQSLIDTVRSNVISSNFIADNVVAIPAGRYRLNSTIIVSPFLKLKAVGRVIFETYITGAPALFVTPQSSDPNFLDIVEKQQWLRSPIINGQDGGFIFVNKLDRMTSNSTAIEFGSRSDLGEYKPLSRYSVVDVAVQNYNIGFKMNRFRHYIGTFERIHIELCDTGVVYGDGSNSVDSGENFHFINSIFAIGSTAIRWLSDGFDTHFTNCSFDFLRRVFHMSRGYKIVTVTGGHIEKIDEEILLEDSTSPADNERSIVVSLNGVSLFVPKRNQFVGSSKVELRLNSIDYRQYGLKNDVPPTSDALVSDSIILRTKDISVQQRGGIPQLKSNKIIGSSLANETTGVVTSLNNFTLSGGAVSFEVVEDNPRGGKSLRILGTAINNSYGIVASKERISSQANDVIISNFDIKQTISNPGGANNLVPVIRYRFYNSSNVLLITREVRLDYKGAQNIKVNEWSTFEFSAITSSPQGTSYFTVDYQVAGAALSIDRPIYLANFYTDILK